ncbi:MAG TPA: YqaA family protein [Candidatus Nanoarchaeia archaeon]|nr:YqaA family protein [Candidatus Nanoarchaeia archaeon]
MRMLRQLHFYTFGLLRRLYEYVLSWAHKRYATAALFVLAFIESSFFPIPPDVLQIALSVSRPKRAFFYASVALVGSVLGAIFGYIIGMFFYETVGKGIIAGLGYEAYFAEAGALYNQYAVLAVLIAAISPIPYKVFTIAAGVFQISLLPFIGASVVGRGARFFTEAALIYFFGPRIQVFIDRYFNALAILAALLLVGGFVLVRYLA